ncbi:septum formation initiator family protein [Paenibacillus sp. M1]|uniref:Septum formation initiator family protein n=1 Tax=Paenibacillus haidiansis TaxID=1574488 RepID=A0ABU7VZ26_9BACL
MRDTAARTNRNTTNNNGPAVKSAGARRRMRLWMSFMVLFLGWAGYTYIDQSGEIGNKQHELAERQAVKDENDQALNQLKYELNRLNDPEYIGQIAMKKYGLYKPGEIPVRVSESESGND